MMKMVKFKDGTYGIRRGWFNKEYKDLGYDLWWGIKNSHIGDCKSTYEKVLQHYNLIVDKGSPI